MTYTVKTRFSDTNPDFEHEFSTISEMVDFFIDCFDDETSDNYKKFNTDMFTVTSPDFNKTNFVFDKKHQLQTLAIDNDEFVQIEQAYLTKKAERRSKPSGEVKGSYHRTLLTQLSIYNKQGHDGFLANPQRVADRLAAILGCFNLGAFSICTLTDADIYTCPVERYQIDNYALGVFPNGSDYGGGGSCLHRQHIHFYTPSDYDSEPQLDEDFNILDEDGDVVGKAHVLEVVFPNITDASFLKKQNKNFEEILFRNDFAGTDSYNFNLLMDERDYDDVPAGHTGWTYCCRLYEIIRYFCYYYDLDCRISNRTGVVSIAFWIDKFKKYEKKYKELGEYRCSEEYRKLIEKEGPMAKAIAYLKEHYNIDCTPKENSNTADNNPKKETK